MDALEHGGASDRNEQTQWSGRPWTARLLRVAAYAIPFTSSVVAAYVLSEQLPEASGTAMRVGRWLLVAVISTLVLIGVDRLARRLLPLAALFSLTLVFPDQAPSRFKVALRTGTTGHLRRAIEDARAGRVGSTPTEAAEKLLELVGALSLHDRITRGHSERVRAYTHMVGEELGISGNELELLRWAGLLHDIGKLLVPAEILNKPGKLDDAEFAVIRQHPDFGRELIAPLGPWLGAAAAAVWEHHERWDGGGYPRGLSGENISLAGRVVAVVDAFDVMTSARSYKEPMPPAEARAELARCAGSHFDPHVVRAFLSLSLGRLRMAMGPLSWLTQLSFVPHTVATAGATGVSAAVTGVVGLGAAAIGSNIDDTPRPLAAAAVDEHDGEVLDPGAPVVVGPSGEGDPSTTVAGGTIGSAGAKPASTTTPRTTTSVSTTTEPTDGPTTTTGEATPEHPTTSAPEPDRGAPPAAPPAAPTPPPPDPGGVTPPPGEPTPPPATQPPPAQPPTQQPPPVTQPPQPQPTQPPATQPPATQPPVTDPPALAGTYWYLHSAGPGDHDRQTVLAMTGTPPPGGALANADADHDADPGLTVRRGEGTDPRERQRFRLQLSNALSVRGQLSADLGVAAVDFRRDDITVRASLRRCNDGATPSCTTIAEQVVSIAGGPTFAQVRVDFGAVDTTVNSGQSLELWLTVPNESERDVWVAFGRADHPSAVIWH